ncbi:hypothetical protein KY285_034278 [Solanum tuberosum]|nr:hypothetical protein KY284_034255 [Solanum tuberosum]KAH0649030.1 hypothetical protein KY285_034278 [Solanum tuberosum]KAH0674177.1 hypothetical protein KY284_025264 [Solanum tuberosum]
MRHYNFSLSKADRGGGESSPEEDTKIWSRRKASTGFLSLRFPLFFVYHGVSQLVHLKQQLDCIAIASSILLIGCYSLLSTPWDWTEVSYLDDLRALGAVVRQPIHDIQEPEIGKKEGELPEAEIWKMHWFWKKVLPK